MEQNELTVKDKKFLRLTSKFSKFIFIGFIAFSLGGMYVIWAVQQLDPKKFPNIEQAFDRPVTQFVRLAQPYEEWIDTLKPSTDLEQDLIDRLKRSRDINIRMALFIARLFLGTFCLTLGLLFLSSGLTSGQYHQLFNKLLNHKEEFSSSEVDELI
ncbi:MAG: hypothetical protein K8S27_15520 [Candidatus Omnitrophica bacterium]|nr:hypothetical protein [Candidatus Omnitrophota bacterium]